MRLAAIWVLDVLLLAGPALCAAEPVPAIPESDSAQAVRLAAVLEADPLGTDANEHRKWLLHWLVETPDYTVKICDILGPLPSQELPYGPELLVQQMFGNVAFQIQNPGTTDQAAFQLAGVESVVKVYAVIMANDPKAQHPYFDELLAKQRAGVLKDYMLPIIAKDCAGEPET